MTPQERQLIEDLFDRLARVESAPRDPEAENAIAEAWQRAPNAAYALVQTVLLQEEALKRAHQRITELEGAGAAQQAPASFLDPARDSVFGHSRGSVPNVPPPASGRGDRPAWNTGQALGGATGAQDRFSPPPPPQSPVGGGGGSFLGTAAAAAAGVVGGSILMNSLRSLMGGGQHGFGDANSVGGGTGGSSNPWSSDQSGGNLARDAGVNDIGSGSRAADANQTDRFDQAQNDTGDDDDGYDDYDDSDLDDFDGGGDSDFA